MKKLQFLAALLLSGFMFVAHAATDWNTQEYDLYPGDFNGDGKTDLLYVAKDATKPSGIALSDGNGPNLPLQSWPSNYLNIPWSGNVYKPIVADFNGDGRADVFMQRSLPGEHYVILANMEGKLVGINQAIGDGGIWSADQHTIVAGDFNGDSKADLFLQAARPGLTNYFVPAGEGGAIGFATQSWNDNSYLGLKWSRQDAFVYVGDFNGDRKADLLLQARPKFVQINSTTVAIPIPTYQPNLNAVVTSQGGGNPFQLAGVKAFNRKQFGGDFSPLRSTVVVGDFNGDGRDDVVLQSRKSGDTSYLLTGNASGAAFSAATALASNVALSADGFRLVTANFDGGATVGVYFQTTSPSGTNGYANTITGSSITTTVHDPSSATGIVPATATGLTPGSFAIGDDGTANYSIPIVVPPGVAGVQPQLALTYSSQRGNGWLGIGWDISGLSQITRCNKTFAQDGVAEAVALSRNDRFCLDGTRLRLTSGTYGFAGSTYQTEIETFARITAYSSAGNGPAYFILEAKNGFKYEYGNTGDSRIDSLSASAGGTPRTWALNKVTDRAGNTMTVSYMEDLVNGSFHPTEMLYTSNTGANVSAAYKVKFVWESRPAADSLSGYFAGGLIREVYRLNRIETQFNDPAVGGFRLVRKYQLSYGFNGSTSRSRLVAVQECEYGGTCLSPTNIGWQEGQSGLTTPTEIPPPPGHTTAFNSAALIDVSGDGRDDLLQLGIYLSIANASGGFDPPLQVTVVKDTTNSFDYNGDGKVDVLYSSSGPNPPYSPDYKVLQSTGTGFTAIPTGIADNTTGIVKLADVDGNGRADMIFSDRNTPSTITVAFNGPSGFAQPVTVFTSQQPFISVRAIMGVEDFNGDGRADLLIETTTVGSARLLLSQGSSYIDTGRVLPNFPSFVAADINGDGVNDATYNCSSNRCIRFGGAGAPSVGLGDERNTGQTASPVGAKLLPIDWDSDGKTDLLQGSSSGFQLLRSTGESFALPLGTGIPTASAASADTNGDGLKDVLFTTIDNSGASPRTITSLSLHHPGIADLMTSIADGFGNTTNVTYAPLTDASVYTKGSGAVFPQSDIQRPMQVVKQYTQTDGTGGNFTVSAKYSGARIDQSGRGFLGFASRRLEDSRDRIAVFDYYRQDFPFIGAVSQHDEFQPDNGPLISRVINNYKSTTLDGTANNQRYLVTPENSTSRRYEVGGSKNGAQVSEQVTVLLFDSFANPTDITVTTTDKDSGSPFVNQAFTTRTVNVFSTDMGAAWCSLPTQTSVTNTLPSGAAQTRTVGFAVNLPFCRATQQVVEPAGGPVRVTRNFEYDNCGNVKTIRVIGTKPDATPMIERATSIDYGSRCVFPVKVTNPLGQATTADYRYELGVQKSSIDPNGFTTSAIHDNFGRLLRRNRIDGTATDVYYLRCSVANNYCNVPDLRFQVQSVERDTTNATISTAVTFFDSLGRERISQAQRVTGAVSYVSTTYDSLGRAATVSRPYSSSSNGFSRNTYDLVDRLTKVEFVRPDSSVDRASTITYAGGTVSATDPKLNTKQQVFDAIGNLRRVTDAAGMTQYTYDPFQNLQTVVDPAGNTTTAGFNIRGFRTSLADPDLGNLAQTYNSLGELISQTDAKNQTVSFVYDALSRPLTRTEPEGVTAFTYDTAARGVGALASVSSPGGFAQAFQYDGVGRTQQVTFTEDTTYQVNYDYNNLGLLDAVTYPASTSSYRLKLKYAYAYGSLVQVKDFNAPNTVFWTLNTTDDADNPIEETLGNGVRQITGYDQLTGELINRKSGSGGLTTNLQNLTYQWDKTGNLKQRQDGLQNRIEAFSYDSLDRLTSSTLDGISNLTVGFDTLGNITSKSDVGTYNYTTAQTDCSYYAHSQPHAVRKAGSNVYCYDQNGNMTKRAGSTISYTSYDLPSQINQGTNSSQFSYDANRQRWKQVATYSGTTETTIYVGGLLDKVMRGGVTEYRHYIATGSDASAIYTRRSDGTTDTYYVTGDHLGSTSVITDHTGALKQRESFTAYGARRGSNWSGAPSASDLSQIAGITRDGFTGHEHLDNLNLIHMNGRVYDPTLGRFLSADPIVQDPTNSQSLNRYSYVFNSPLSYTDPSGYNGSSTAGYSLTFAPPVIPVIGSPAFSGPDFGTLPGASSSGLALYGNAIGSLGGISFGFSGPSIGIGGNFGSGVSIASITNPIKGADGFVTGTGTGNVFQAVGAFLFPNVVALGERGVRGSAADYVTGFGKAALNAGRNVGRFGNPLGAIVGDLLGTSTEFEVADNEVAGAATFEVLTVVAPIIGRAAGVGRAAGTVANPVPGELARVVAGNRSLKMLGRPDAPDVFVVASDDIAGMNAAELSRRLTIPASDTFTVVRFPTPTSGVASPVARTNPGFVQGGRTRGGAREFVIPNGPIPAGSKITVIGQ